MNKGSFKKGQTPWNKGKEGFNPSPETQFKTGELVGKDHPSWKGGVHMVKNDCAHLWTGANKRARRPRVIYEEYYGPIPKGYVVIHIDGNRYNDDIGNLEAISRADNLKRNQINRK